MTETAKPRQSRGAKFKLFLAGDFESADISGRKKALWAFGELLIAAAGCTFPAILVIGLLSLPGHLIRRTGLLKRPGCNLFFRLLAQPAVGLNLLYLYAIEPGVILVATVMMFTTFPLYALITPFILAIFISRRFSWSFGLLIWGLLTVWPVLSRYNVFANVDYARIDNSRYVRPLLYNEPGHEREAQKILEGYHVLVRNLLLSPDGKTVFVSNFDPMDRGDTTRLPSIIKIPVDAGVNMIEYVIYTYSQELAYDTRRDLLYVAGHSADRLAMLSVNPLKIIKEVATPDKPHNLVYHQEQDLLYVVHESSRLRIYQPGTLQFVRTLESSPWLMSPFEPQVDLERKNVLIGSLTPIYQLGELNLDGVSPPRLGTVGLGTFAIDLYPPGDSILYTDTFLGILEEIDRDSWEIKRWKFVGGSPRKVVFDEKRDLIYVAKFFRQEMGVYDAKTWAEVAEVPVGINARDIRIAPNGLLYVGSTAGVLEVDIDSLLTDIGETDRLRPAPMTTPAPSAATEPVE